jgi:hypothetical protein
MFSSGLSTRFLFFQNLKLSFLGKIVRRPDDEGCTISVRDEEGTEEEGTDEEGTEEEGTEEEGNDEERPLK